MYDEIKFVEPKTKLFMQYLAMDLENEEDPAKVMACIIVADNTYMKATKRYEELTNKD